MRNRVNFAIEEWKKDNKQIITNTIRKELKKDMNEAVEDIVNEYTDIINE